MSKTGKELKEIAKGKPVYRNELPERETLNNIFRQFGIGGINDIVKNAKEVAVAEPHISPTEAVKAAEVAKPLIHQAKETERSTAAITPRKSNSGPQAINPKLEILHESKLLYEGKLNDYYVLGNISQEMNNLKVTLLIEERSCQRKERIKIDLYERDFLRQYTKQLAGQFNEDIAELETDFHTLIDLIEQYREQQLSSLRGQEAITKKASGMLMSMETEKACIEFLSKPNLLERIDKLIEGTGVVGEENNRRLLFIIASTYKMNTPLHSLVQGISGSGKSHLINSIGQCFPPEDVMSMTRVTSKSFYHYTRKELVDKLILIQDFDGLDEEAQYAFRELQSAGNISSSTVYKDKQGNINSMIKNVKSHFASLLATTKAEIYYDNMSRSVIIGVDEADAQTERIIQYQNKKLAGIIDENEERKTKEFLQNVIRCIKPMEVVNPYADKIKLPVEAKMLRRLNNHYQAFVKQITILHQYQRRRDKEGRLIAEPADLKMACDILFDAIIMKVDDLDSSLRQFYDRIKVYLKKKGIIPSPVTEEKEGPAINVTTEKRKGVNDSFTQREIRLALNAPKATCFRNMENLVTLEYIQKTGGYANKGYTYKMAYWDDIEKVRTKIKAELNAQLEKLNGKELAA